MKLFPYKRIPHFLSVHLSLPLGEPSERWIVSGFVTNFNKGGEHFSLCQDL